MDADEIYATKPIETLEHAQSLADEVHFTTLNSWGFGKCEQCSVVFELTAHGGTDDFIPDTCFECWCESVGWNRPRA